MLKKLTVSALGLVLVAPAFAEVDVSFAISALAERRTDLVLIGGALVTAVLAVFPLRFVAKMFRG